LKPNCLRAKFDGIICNSASICTGHKQINDVDTLRLWYIKQRCVSMLAMSSFTAGVNWDDGAPVIYKSLSDAKGWAFGIRRKPNNCPNRPEMMGKRVRASKGHDGLEHIRSTWSTVDCGVGLAAAEWFL
jgi:hypothetical protein